MEKRAFKRLPVKLQARLYWGNKIYPGVVTSLSENGMFISTRMSPPFDAVLEVVVTMGKGFLKFPGNVRWSVKVNYLDDSDDENIMGVEFLDVPPDYLKFVKSIKSGQSSANTS